MAEFAGELVNYVTDGEDCVEFRLVTCPEDLNDLHDDADGSAEQTKQNGTSSLSSSVCKIPPFAPIMCYQTFGDNEKVFGYREPKIRLFYSAGRLNIYNGLKYTEIIDTTVHKGIKPDPVLKSIADDYECDIEYNIDEFVKQLSDERSFVPPGTSYNEFYIDVRQKPQQLANITNGSKGVPQTNGTTTTTTTTRKFFQIFSADFSTPNFIPYHTKMQTFLKWYIEAASYLETDDHRFEFFMIFQKLPLNSKSDDCHTSPTEFQYVFAGYCSVVRFYYYPDKIRPRISQFLILPPFQGHGLGTKLYENIINYYNNAKVYDITVESPESEFQLIRDYVDCKRCMNLDEFSVRNVREGWNKKMANKAREVFKIHGPQARRVYEIIRQMNIKPSDVFEQKAYNELLYTRLDGAYQQQIQRLEKFQNRYSVAEFAKLMAMIQVPGDVRNAEIESQIGLIKKDYDKVIARLLKPQL